MDIISDLENQLDRIVEQFEIPAAEFAGSLMVPHDLAEWLQTNLDPQRNLLKVAFAYKLTGLIRPAAARARGLRELVVAEASSEEAEAYLSEACECYFFGLYSASAVMCRSLLEEALERKLPTDLFKQWQNEAVSRKQELTLGTVLYKVNNHALLLVSPAFLKPARRVNEIATQAAHKKTIGQQEAANCLRESRKALTTLLGGN